MRVDVRVSEDFSFKKEYHILHERVNMITLSFCHFQKGSRFDFYRHVNQPSVHDICAEITVILSHCRLRNDVHTSDTRGLILI